MSRLPYLDVKMGHKQKSKPGSVEEIRFTKLKGVLVNNLLKQYHKQTNRTSDEAVYNRAVFEVEKILRNGKLTEDILKQMQKNFAMSDHDSRSAAAFSLAPPSRLKASKEMAVTKLDGSPPHGHGQETCNESQTLPRDQDGSNTNESSMNRTSSPTIENKQNNGSVHSFSPTLQRGSSNNPTSMSSSKGKQQLDAWSIITLHNDISHLEEQKQIKDKQLNMKAQTREHLLQQMEYKKQQKMKQKAQEQLEAQDLQDKMEKQRLEQEREAKMRKEKLNAARELAALEKERAAAKHQAECDRRIQEEQQMLSEFQRQIDAEKAKKDNTVKEKHKQYLIQQEDNAKELERKRILKQREREENDRLFQMQIAMAEKQEKLRADKEAERQEKLKHSERMAGDINNRAVELTRQEEIRRQRVQEEFTRKEAEREQQKIERKRALESETVQVLEEQIRLHNIVKEKERLELSDYAKEQLRIAQELADVAMREKRERTQKKHLFKQHLDSQVARKQEQRENDALGMNTTELKINSHLLHHVIKQRHDTVGEDLASKISHSPAFVQDNSPEP